MIKHDWIPQAILPFYAFFVHFMEHLDPITTVVTEQFGVGAVDEVVEAFRTFETAHLQTLDPKTCTPGQIAERNSAQKEATAVLRKFVKACIANNPKISDAQRVALGVPVHTGERHPAPVPTTYPECEIDTSVHLQLTIHFHDAGSSRKAKPEGVHGVEVKWEIRDTPPVTFDELTHSSFDTHSPITLPFGLDQRGKTVWIAMRWENTRGEKGPWSLPVSAVIP